MCICVWRQTDWWRSRSSCDSGWTRCWNRWLERGCSHSSSPAGRTVKWRSGHPPSLCRCPPPTQNTQDSTRAQFQAFYYRKHNQSQQLCSKRQIHLCPSIIREAISHPPTLMRQALLTSCLGSTTSTRGSLIATSLMHDISKPYTFSHPDTKTDQSVKWKKYMQITASGVQPCALSDVEVSNSDLTD